MCSEWRWNNFFFEKSKNFPATWASPPDPRVHDMIKLHHFAQATQSRHFSNKKFNFQAPSLSEILIARLIMSVLDSRKVEQLNCLFRFLKRPAVFVFLEHTQGCLGSSQCCRWTCMSLFWTWIQNLEIALNLLLYKISFTMQKFSLFQCPLTSKTWFLRVRGGGGGVASPNYVKIFVC